MLRASRVAASQDNQKLYRNHKVTIISVACPFLARLFSLQPRDFSDFAGSSATGTLPAGEVETEVEMVQVDLGATSLPLFPSTHPHPPDPRVLASRNLDEGARRHSARLYLARVENARRSALETTERVESREGFSPR